MCSEPESWFCLRLASKEVKVHADTIHKEVTRKALGMTRKALNPSAILEKDVGDLSFSVLLIG